MVAHFQIIARIASKLVGPSEPDDAVSLALLLVSVTAARPQSRNWTMEAAQFGLATASMA